MTLMNFQLIVEELLSEAAKCTGPTKKTSSTRKGKKWSKCARQPDGSYKLDIASMDDEIQFPGNPTKSKKQPDGTYKTTRRIL